METLLRGHGRPRSSLSINERRKLSYQKNREIRLIEMREYSKRIRKKAMNRVSSFWGDSEPKCRADTLSVDHPLRTIPCYGMLQIDHMHCNTRYVRSYML